MIKNLLIPCVFLFFACSSSNNISVSNTEWTLTSVKSASGEKLTPSAKIPTLTIDAENNTFGNAGCNQFRGVAEIEKQKIKFGKVIMTRMFCMEGAAIETAFTEMLNTVDNFQIKDNKLYLKKGNETIAEFHK